MSEPDGTLLGAVETLAREQEQRLRAYEHRIGELDMDVAFYKELAAELQQRFMITERDLLIARALTRDVLKHAGEESTCRGEHCGAAIYWVRRNDGMMKRAYNPDGTSHEMTCPDREQ